MNKGADIALYAFIVGGLLVLTRPKSQGPKLLGNLFNGFTHLVQGATGQPLSGALR